MSREPQKSRRIPVYIALPQDLLLLDVAGPVEVLRRANQEQNAVRFEFTFVSPTPELETSIGLLLTGLQPLPSCLPEDAWIIVPGHIEVSTGDNERVAARTNSETLLANWLRSAVRPGHRLITICSGAQLAGRAGLLDGRACTTHHLDCEQLQRDVPTARVVRNRLYVQDGNLYSSAGVAAGIDLMLDVLEHATNRDCAIRVAQYLVLYFRRSGTDPQASPWLHERENVHPAVLRVQDAIRNRPQAAWTRKELEAVAGSSGRNLSRLFREHTGTMVSDYRNRMRVAAARELLNGGQLGLERVAEQAGFSSLRQLRRAWGKIYDHPPSRVQGNAQRPGAPATRDGVSSPRASASKPRSNQISGD